MSFDESPIIVGLSSRVAGARGNAKMWEALANGLCNIHPIDQSRFNIRHYYDPQRTRRGKTYSLMAGQIDDIFLFDAAFFGISPREAEQMDPQQRLMLQSVWEASEDAGLNIEHLAGPRTGVYVGSSMVEHQSLGYTDPERGGSSQALGNTLAIIANRIASHYDFRGPSMVVDTACSASIYALNLGAEALRRGEIDTAIIGGVHISRTAGGYVTFAQARMTSPTGTCSAFDAAADGYVRAEACVTVIMQRPEIAQKMQSRRRARLLASAVNSDGRTAKITVPSSQQQADLLDKVLEQSGVNPEDLTFFEAHGTGTPIGDPVEAQSIGDAIGVLRVKPLTIGSAKTNFGHAEPAAGLVGLAKVLLSFENQAIPPSLNFKTPNPNINFEDLNLQVATGLQPLDPAQPMIAGLNSFGFGGTNASLIVEAERGVDTEPNVLLQPQSHDRWLLLSAASEASLSRLVEKWADLLDARTPDTWPELVAAQGERSELLYRFALQLDGELKDKLRAFLHASPPADENHTTAEREAAEIYGRAEARKIRNVLTFPGNGAQSVAMGRVEYERSSVFREHFDSVANAFLSHSEIDLIAFLNDDSLGLRFHDPLVSAPYTFAYQVSMAKTLIEAGLVPDAVIGHSAGEISALHVAGCFDLETATRIVRIRAELMQEVRGMGTMAVVAASADEVKVLLDQVGDANLVIAAINGPRSVTVSGPNSSLAQLRALRLKGRRLAVLPFNSDIPYHSPFIEPLKDRAMEIFKTLKFTTQTVPVISTVRGTHLPMGGCNASYLWDNMRNMVKFSQALAEACSAGPACIIELAASPTFSNTVRDLAQVEGYSMSYISPSQWTAKGERFDQAVVRAWVKGAHIVQEAIAGRRTGAKPELPSYPWDEKLHFAELSTNGIDAWGERSLPRLAGVNLERASYCWLTDLTPTQPEWIQDHRVGEKNVLPATAILEIMLNIGEHIWSHGQFALHNFIIFAPVIIEDEGQRIRTQYDPRTGRISLHQRPRLLETTWTLVAQADMREQLAEPKKLNVPMPPPQALQTSEAFYHELKTRGLSYGDTFQRLSTTKSVGKNKIWAWLTPQKAEQITLDYIGFDGSLHAIGQLLTQLAPSQNDPTFGSHATLVPLACTELKLVQKGREIASALITLISRRSRSLSVNVVLLDKDNSVIAEALGLELGALQIESRRLLKRRRIERRQVRLLPSPQGSGTRTKWLQRLLRQQKFSKVVGALPLQPLEEKLLALWPELSAGRQPNLNGLLPAHGYLAHDIRGLALLANQKEARSVFAKSFSHKALWHKAANLIRAAIKSWPETERLNLMICGLAPTSLLRELAKQKKIDLLVVGLGQDQDSRILRQSLPEDLRNFIVDEAPEGSIDLLIDVDLSHADPKALHTQGLGVRVSLINLDGLTQDEQALKQDFYAVQSGFSLAVKTFSSTAAPSPASPWVLQSTDGSSDTAEWLKSLQYINPSDSQLQKTAKDSQEPYSVLQLSLDLKRGLTDLITEILDQIVVRLKTQTGPVLIIADLEDGNERIKAALSAALRACVRTIRNESPDQKIAAISLIEGKPDVSGWSELVSCAFKHGHISYKDGQASGDQLIEMPAEAARGQALKLNHPLTGRFEDLKWQPTPRAQPKRGEVLLEVEAAGLNYRDVMSIRNILPERVLELGATKGALGIECVGKIKALGKDVKGYHIGQRVVALAAPSFATHVCAQTSAIMPLPVLGVDTQIHDGFDDEAVMAGASIPVAFLTAWHTLINIAQLGPDDRVLIHGGAGGVGLAAIQIAKMRGAQVFATAGTPEKQLIALGYGADHCFNSRTLSFAAEIRELTAGAGVTCVLNSLSGDAMRRSLECLAPFGKFIELGKRDYLEGSHISLAPFLHNLSYHGVDIDQYVAHSPASATADIEAIAKAFEQKKLFPLPVIAFEGDDISNAFQEMYSSHHIGKVAIQPPKLSASPKKRNLSGTWVLIGGNSSLGRKVADALLGAGVKNITILSRSGEFTKILGQEPDNPLIHHLAVDCADPEQLSKALTNLETTDGPIQGLIHMAMVLRDRAIESLDLHEARQVIHAKINVAQAIESAVKDLSKAPEYLIYFSSISALLGNNGQVAYSTASAALEAYVRTAAPSETVNMVIGWPPVIDAGYIPRDSLFRKKVLRQTFIDPIKADELLAELLNRIFATTGKQDPCDYTYCAVDWDNLGTLLPEISVPEYRYLHSGRKQNGIHEKSLYKELIELPWPAAVTRVEAEIRDLFATVMRSHPGAIDFSRPLISEGLDSLMALEVRMELERRFDGKIPHITMSSDLTGAKLAAQILKKIRSDDQESSGE